MDRVITPTDSAAEPVAVRRSVMTRGRVLQWLRTTHVWLGLWGAVLGFGFGFTGFLLNHRAVMKIPVERAEVSRAQVPVQQHFDDPKAFGRWLQAYAHLPEGRVMTRIEGGGTVNWRGNTIEQPERWSATIGTPKLTVAAKYVRGNNSVDVETQDATLLGVLLKLHTGNGVSAFWILVADTIAGALMVLTLSGVLLWTKLRTPRLAGMLVLCALPFAAVVYLT